MLSRFSNSQIQFMLFCGDDSSPISTTFEILLMAQLVLPCTSKSTTLHTSVVSCCIRVSNRCAMIVIWLDVVFSNACKLIICVICSCCVDVCVMMCSSDDRTLVRARGRLSTVITASASF
jgi:hypothetical protein